MWHIIHDALSSIPVQQQQKKKVTKTCLYRKNSLDLKEATFGKWAMEKQARFW